MKLMLIMKKYKLLNDNQYGFRDLETLCMVTCENLPNLEQHKKLIGIFLQLGKAFDTVDHQTLPDRFDHIGIKGISNSLLRSYLRIGYSVL